MTDASSKLKATGVQRRTNLKKNKTACEKVPDTHSGASQLKEQHKKRSGTSYTVTHVHRNARVPNHIHNTVEANHAVAPT